MANSLRANEAMLFVFEHNARQPAGGKSAGVYIDPIRQHLWLWRWCVAMHNDLAEIHCAAQKLVSDPNEIIFTLPLTIPGTESKSRAEAGT